MFNVRTNELLNEDEASQILMEEVIKPDELLHDIIAFTIHEILQPGDIITSTINNYTIDSPTWFFWVNDYPYFDFAHTTRYVFIDARSGEVKNITYEDFPPWLNGECLWIDYFNRTDWVFSTYYGPPPIYNITYEIHRIVSNSDNGKRCAILYKGAHKSTRETNCKAIEKVLEDNGFDTEFIDMNFNQFKNKINNLKTRLKSGDELVIYIDSHGGQYRRVGGRVIPKPATQCCKDAYVVMEQRKKNGKWVSTKAMTDRGFKTLLTGFKEGVRIKVIIRACYSGGFIDDLQQVGNVKVIITSTDHDSMLFRSDLKTVQGPKSKKFPEWRKLKNWLQEKGKLDKWMQDDDRGTKREGLSEFAGGVVTGLSKNLGDYIKGKITQTQLFEETYDEILEVDEWYKNRKLVEEYWEYLKDKGKNPSGWGANNWAEEPQKYLKEEKDTEKPKVKIKTPKDGEEVKDKNCSLSGFVTDDVGVVKIGYIHKAMEYFYEYNETIASAQNYSFEWEIELIEGWNNLTVYAMDEAGNVGDDSVIVCYYPEDVEPPFVEITWPEDGYESEIANITIIGYANDTVGIVSIGSHHEWGDGEVWTSGTVDPPKHILNLNGISHFMRDGIK